MYLDEKRIARGKRGVKIRLVLAVCLCLLWAMGTVWGITDYNGMRDGMEVYVIFLVLSLIWLYICLRRRGRLDAAGRYASVFAGDRDGEIPVQELARMLKKNRAAVVKELRWLVEKGYVVNCGFVTEDVEKVVLEGAKGQTEGGFISVECPHCGAGNLLRRGAAGKCEYCGGYLSADGRS